MAAVDVVDILGERIYLAMIGMLHNSEKSTDYHNGFVKSPDYKKFKPITLIENTNHTEIAKKCWINAC